MASMLGRLNLQMVEKMGAVVRVFLEFMECVASCHRRVAQITGLHCPLPHICQSRMDDR